MVNSLTLDCGHTVYTDVELRQQYPTDIHYVFCPACRKSSTNPRVPSAWSKVISEVENVSNVPSEFTWIMPRDIMRLQPSVPRNRVRPFPYVERPKGPGRADNGRARRSKG